MEDRYSESEKQFVIENYNKMTKKEIARCIGRSESSVKTFGQRNGLCGKSSKKWTDDEIEFLKNNYMNMTQQEMADKLGRGYTAIKTKCSLLGLVKLDLGWSDSHSEFLKNNYKNMTATEISKILNCKVSTVRNKAFDMGLLKDRYTIDKKFFKFIDTEEKAYWLGFLYADGCVRKFKGKSQLCVGLNERDLNHLEKLKKSLKSNAPISKRRRDNVVILTINCTELAEDLILLGCIPRKTYSELSIPLNIPQDLKRHFIRGFVDGDGWIIDGEYNGFDKVGIGIVSHKKNILLDFRKEFEKLDLRSKDKKIIYCDSSDVYTMTYASKTDSHKILNYLYNNSTIYLDRKYEKAQKSMQRCRTTLTSIEDVVEKRGKSVITE